MTNREIERDGVTGVLARMGHLVRGRPSDSDVEALMTAMDALDPLAFVRLDERSRSWGSGMGPGEIARLHSRWRRGSKYRLWSVLALMSADGHDRERAATETTISRTTVALLAVRATDWVPQVRTAALARLAATSAEQLMALMPLIEALSQDRSRARSLDELVESRLADDDLRAATASPDPRSRRAAWRRLVARDAYEARELRTRAVNDPDVLVRTVAAELMGTLEEADRRAIAERLVADPIGWLAGRGLEVLIELDGDTVIVQALTASNATLRRRARDWAAVRGVDGRAVYLTRLRADPDDALALIALSEIGDSRDEELLVTALGDRRSRVRASAVCGLAHVNRSLGVEAAVTELVTGGSARTSRAAARVLRRSSLGDLHLQRVELVALDDSRPVGQRLRALALLRPARWQHLAAILQAGLVASPPLAASLDQELNLWLEGSRHLSRGPDPARREVIASCLQDVDEGRRRSIEFVLRTTST